MKKIHDAWRVCLGCAILIFVTSGLVANAFSIYLPYILSYNGFTNTQLSAILTARIMTGFVSMFLTGLYYKLIDLRRGMVMAGYLVAAGFFGYGIATNYTMYLLSAVFAGMGYGLGTMVPIGMILNRWFETDLPLALGLCGSVTGLSTLGLPTLIAYSVEHFGLGKTFITESILIVGLITICYCLLSNSPEAAGCEPYRRAAGKKAKSERKDPDTQYAPVMSGKLSILLVLIAICTGTYASSAYSHLSVFMTSEGITPQTASFVILLSGLGVTTSKLVYGLAAERFSAYWANWTIGSLSFFGMVISFFAGSSVVGMGIGITIYSLGLGLTTTGLPVWASDLSKPEDFDKNNRRLQVGYAAGGLAFSTMPGIIADMNRGSYKMAILLFATTSLLAVLAIQVVYNKAKVK